MLRRNGPWMGALVSVLLATGVAFSARAADDSEELDRMVKALNRDAASDPEMARGIREKLGPHGLFLLTSPTNTSPTKMEKVPPGEALVLHALCPACGSWTSVVTMKDGQPVTLAQLLAMHEQQHMGWGKLSQDVLGMKLGPLVSQVAAVQKDLRAPASRGKGAGIRLLEEDRPGGDGGGGGMGHRSRSAGGRGR